MIIESILDYYADSGVDLGTLSDGTRVYVQHLVFQEDQQRNSGVADMVTPLFFAEGILEMPG